MKERLEQYDSVAVNLFTRYVDKLCTELDKEKKLKNWWATKLSVDSWVAYFEKVEATGFFIDGDSITINNNGISLNYQAYKNMVLRAYPEATFDVQLIREGDTFSFSKESGKVHYSHTFGDPFGNKNIIGGYGIVKLRTGEHIELLTKTDFEKMKKVSRMGYIWKEWYEEMCIKSIIKRMCKRHFKDVVKKLDDMDMVNYDLPGGEVVTVEEDVQERIDACNTNKDLTTLWRFIKSHKRTAEQTTATIEACKARKQQIGEENANT